VWVRNYYDLVAGLADISPDTARVPFSTADFISQTAELVHPDDAVLLRLLQLPVDNHNLVILLDRMDKHFEPGGAYDRETLAAEIANPETLPEYMRLFIDAHRAGDLLLPDLNNEDHLSWFFFEKMTIHENDFIASWFTFDLHLRNILTALAIRRNIPHLQQREPEYLRCLESALVCRTDVEERLLSSAAPDFGLIEHLPWIERVLQLPVDDFIERERRIDLLRWDMLEELTTFTYFQIETLLAFCLRLMIVERWMRLDPQTGRMRLEQLLLSLKPGVQTAAKGAA
jgi:hypothetical protein